MVEIASHLLKHVGVSTKLALSFVSLFKMGLTLIHIAAFLRRLARSIMHYL